jgi:hypothetical protein
MKTQGNKCDPRTQETKDTKSVRNRLIIISIFENISIKMEESQSARSSLVNRQLPEMKLSDGGPGSKTVAPQALISNQAFVERFRINGSAVCELPCIVPVHDLGHS